MSQRRQPRAGLSVGALERWLSGIAAEIAARPELGVDPHYRRMLRQRLVEGGTRAF